MNHGESNNASLAESELVYNCSNSKPKDLKEAQVKTRMHNRKQARASVSINNRTRQASDIQVMADTIYSPEARWTSNEKLLCRDCAYASPAELQWRGARKP